MNEYRDLLLKQIGTTLSSLGISLSFLPFIYEFPEQYVFKILFLLANGKAYKYIYAIYKLSNQISELKKIELESEYWNNISTNYNIVIKKFDDLLNKMSFENPIEIFVLYVYMYRCGYLSFKNSFIYQTNKVKDVLELYGVDVIRGTGCCRHISSMLKDIYDIRKIDNSLCSVKTKIDDLENDWCFSLTELNCFQDDNEKKKILFDLLSLNSIHIINWVKISDNTGCWLDPTNDLYSFNKKNRLYLADQETKLFKIHKSHSPEYPKDSLFRKNNLSFDEYKSIYEKINKIIIDNEDVFKNFYSENRECYEEIFGLTENYAFGPRLKK